MSYLQTWIFTQHWLVLVNIAKRLFFLQYLSKSQTLTNVTNKLAIVSQRSTAQTLSLPVIQSANRPHKSGHPNSKKLSTRVFVTRNPNQTNPDHRIPKHLLNRTHQSDSSKPPQVEFWRKSDRTTSGITTLWLNFAAQSHKTPVSSPELQLWIRNSMQIPLLISSCLPALRLGKSATFSHLCGLMIKLILHHVICQTAYLRSGSHRNKPRLRERGGVSGVTKSVMLRFFLVTAAATRQTGLDHQVPGRKPHHFHARKSSTLLNFAGLTFG